MAKKDIINLINKYEEQLDSIPWTGSLEEYLKMVVDDPSLNRSAHEYIRDMVIAKGVRFKESDEKKETPIYEFFASDLFGVENYISKVMQYFKSAAAGSEVARRIPLMYGPTSSGKSQTATLIKEGLEEYCRTPGGRIYAIDGCPMQENPLNALPKGIRKKVQAEYGLIIQGDLCPRCAYILKEEYKGDIWKIPVKRFFFSEMGRQGIGTFQPADPKCIRGESLVLNTKGLNEINSFGEDHEDIIENDIILEDGSTETAKTFFRYENKNVIDIETTLGYRIGGTENHPLMTVSKDGDFQWKNLCDFSVGDVVVMVKGQGLECFEKKELPKNELNIKWTDNFAKFLGLFISEGYMYKRGYHALEITNFSENIQDIVFSAMKEIGLFDKCRMRVGNTGIRINSKILVSILREWGFNTGAHNKTIPEICYSGKIIQVLNGMWLGDGNIGKHANKNTNEASYSTVSPILANQVHVLLLQLGIPSQKQFYPDAGTSGAYKIVVTGDRVIELKEKLNLPSWKQTRPLIEKTGQTNIFVIPEIDNLVNKVCYNVGHMSDWHRYTVSDKSYGRRFTKYSLNEFINEVKDKCDPGDLNKLNLLNSDNYLFTYIKNKTYNIADVYDIEVPNGHKFIANGFLSHNSQNQSELVGSVSFAKLEEYGVESHPMAYIFDGELNVGNRGFVEFIELLKVDPKFRYILLGLAQEKRIKAERFPLIYADLVPFSHTNETEYNKFLGQEAEEALHDRLWVIKSPYNLSVTDEIKIYEKLVSSVPEFKKVHIAPHTFEIAAMFAVLSRLAEPKDKQITLVQKMHLFDDKHIDGISNEDAKALKEENERDGMVGVSPRYIVNRLSACFTKEDKDYINPIDAIRSIVEGFETNAKLTKEDINRFEQLISECVNEYDKIALNEVQKAFFVNFENEIQTLLKNYLENAEAYLEDGKVKNEFGDFDEPDERLMRNIEEKIDVTETGKKTFRGEVVRKMLRSTTDGKYDYASHPKLKEGLEQQLFDERKDTIRLTVSTRNPDPDELRRKNEVLNTLVEKYSYTTSSANSLLRYVDTIMKRSGNTQ